MRRVELCALLQGTLDAALAIDGEGRVCRLNAAAEALFGSEIRVGYTACTTLLRGCSQHGHSICSYDCAVLRRAASGQPTESFECMIETLKGRRWFSISTFTFPPQDGGVLLIHTLRDMDARKKLEVLMQRFLSQLSKLVGEKVEALTTPPAPHVELTAQEQLVLSRLVEGEGTKEIAAQMGISTATVRNHINHILHRLSVHSRTEAVLRAVRERLV